MKKMDVRITDTIVCYDSLGMLAAPRISWMLRAFGAKNVHVLNGCLYQWKRDQLPISQGQQDNEAFARKRQTKPEEGAYDFKINPKMVANFESIKGKLVLDVRDKRLFDKGHIPESVQFYYKQLLEENSYKSR